MVKVLIGIKTCHKADYFIDQDTRDWLNDKGMRELNVAARREAQRDTFLRNLGEDFDYRFFYGDRLRDNYDEQRRKPSNYKDTTRDLPTPLGDETYLPVLDTYMNVGLKTQQIVRYALAEGYELLFLIDDDTFVYPKNLRSVIQKYDLTNKVYAGAPTSDFHTGNMLFLNRKGMEIVSKEVVTHYADDLWIGGLMKARGIMTFDIPEFKSDFGTRYVINAASVPDGNKYAALHSCKPATMRALYGLDFTIAPPEPIEQKPAIDPSIIKAGNKLAQTMLKGLRESMEVVNVELQGGKGNSGGLGEPVPASPGELQPSSVRGDSGAESVTNYDGHPEGDILRTFENGGSNPLDGETSDDGMGGSGEGTEPSQPDSEVS